jgi:hypothetical protein
MDFPLLAITATKRDDQNRGFPASKTENHEYPTHFATFR